MLHIRQKRDSAPEMAQEAYARRFNKKIRRYLIVKIDDQVYLGSPPVW